jgi:ubiquitin carboxyl-terminal hydrolase L3
MGLIHALANAGIDLPESSPIGRFVQQARALPRQERAKLLEESELFADAHVEASSAGQALLRDEDADTQLHFTAFVQAMVDGEPHLIELNGIRRGPVDHGPSSGDLLSVREALCAVRALSELLTLSPLQDAARLIKDRFMAADPTSILFNICCLGGPAEDD